MRRLLSQDDAMAVFYATEIECVSAFARRLREGSLGRASFDGAINILIVLLEHWMEILPTHDLRLDAEVLLTRHSLKTADALQLALDDRLRTAADDEGFTVLPQPGA